MSSFLRILNQIDETISNGDYEEAKELVCFLHRSFLNYKKKKDIYARIEEINLLLEEENYDKLSDILLTLADHLFAISPTKTEENRFKETLKNVYPKLHNGTVQAATEAISLIEESINEHLKKKTELQTKGFYDHHAFCLFWKLWFLLDEVVRTPDFLGNYESTTSMLYGIISAAINSKEAILCLAKNSDEIYETKNLP